MTTAARILVVEDDPILRGLLVDVIDSDADLCATGAASIAEADAKLGLRGEAFDAMLLDQHLPDGHGGDFCQRLRLNGVTIPILILSGEADRRAGQRSRAQGASDHIQKPVQMRELINRLTAQLSEPSACL
ncbi:response regulator transcription factor [Falsiroseomonas sp. E2-1-a20]|uniref:response regulator transcription factor n=1 Tax=Falsiroseomonas sp. E2-1-a20 TaxID=3239300 RepID=UPI003F2DD30A